eukprot:gene18313-biopygen5406
MWRRRRHRGKIVVAWANTAVAQ